MQLGVVRSSRATHRSASSNPCLLCSAATKLLRSTMCPPAKRSRDTESLPNAIVKHLVQYIPHNTYLYLYKSDREPVCCQQSLLGVCNQCDAVRMHAARMWPCLRRICSPKHDEAGRSVFDQMVNGVLELHLNMQHDGEYEPVYHGHSISQAHDTRAAWKAQPF
jgi:hypothetical protein